MTAHSSGERAGDSQGVYHIRPDKSTSMVAVIGLAAFAWFANQWADGVSSDSEEALEKSEQALQMNERQSDQLQRLSTQIDQSITSAIAPLQLRMDDLSKQYSAAYSTSAAERDKALTTQEIMQIKSDINANQNSIQQATGRVESVEKNLEAMNTKLEQIYQAIVNKPQASSDMMITPGGATCFPTSSIFDLVSSPAPAAARVPSVWTTTC